MKRNGVYFFTAKGKQYFAERVEGSDDEYTAKLPAIHIRGTEEELHSAFNCIDSGRLTQTIEEAIKLGLPPQIRNECKAIDWITLKAVS